MQDLVEVSCYLCRASAGGTWAEENGFQLRACAGCGLLYVSPRPHERAISQAHQTGEHRTAEGSLQVTGKFSPRAVQSNAATLRALFAPAHEPGALPALRSWLDVGAGNGELLLAVSALWGPGVERRGVEPNRIKRAQAAEQAVQLSEQLDAVRGQRFDVISLVNVYSHLADPPRFLAGLLEQLAPGGSLVLVTGNAAELARREQYPDALDLPDHLSFVGRAHLVQLMEGLGLRLAKLVELRHDTFARLVKNARRALRGERVRLRVPYTSAFRSLWCRFERS